MPKPKKNSTAANSTGANVGYEAQLWQMVGQLRDQQAEAAKLDAAIAANLRELGYGG